MSKLKSIYKRFSSALRGIDLPIDCMVCKGFAAPEQTNHYRFLEEYEHDKDTFDPESTEYFQSIITDSRGDLSEFYLLPDNLDIQPVWWIMPWGQKVRAPKQRASSERRIQATAHVQKLIGIYESIKKNGYSPWKGGAMSGYILEHPDKGSVFNYIDGHHRLAALSFLKNNNLCNTTRIRVLPIATINRNDLLEYPSCQKGIQAGHFTKKDALLLFDNAFNALAKREVMKNS